MPIARTSLSLPALLLAAGVIGLPGPAAAADTSDLSYEAQVDSRSRLKCLYGYAADKTGDHATAIAIFEDCIARWNDVYSMIWLAHLYENGLGVPRDLVRATALLQRGAEAGDEAGYSSLARYHYGVALNEGRGTARDPQAARVQLQRAAQEGVADAAEYLAGMEKPGRQP